MQVGDHHREGEREIVREKEERGRSGDGVVELQVTKKKRMRERKRKKKKNKENEKKERILFFGKYIKIPTLIVEIIKITSAHNLCKITHHVSKILISYSKYPFLI